MEQFYTKIELENRDYLFLSYKHDDADTVHAVRSQLYDLGVQIWYDADLHIGDNWLERATERINNPRCKGVIFFNSVSSFLSKPVHQERLLTLARIKKEKQQGKTFDIFPVNIGCSSNIYLLKRVFDSLEKDPAAVSQSFPFEYVRGITELFNDETIYADPGDPLACAEKLLTAIADRLPGVIDLDYVHAKKMEQSIDKAPIQLGICKGEPTSSIPDYELPQDGRLTYKREDFIVWNRQAYRARPIAWRLLDCKDDVFALLAQDVVDTRTGGPELQSWLAGPFMDHAFTAEEKALIQGIRLMTQEEMAEARCKDSFPLQNTHWWISDLNAGALQRVIRKDGTVYSNGYNFRNTKSGVRPVLLISRDDLLKLIKK